MKSPARKNFLSGLLLVLAASSVHAAGGDHLEPAGVNIKDIAALQRGAKVFVNYCLSCHSANYMRYNRLSEDLGLSEEVVMENLVFAEVKIGDTMSIAMHADDAERWFGKTPPDLSVRGRSRGADWLYAYLRSFYQDESGHWNNRVLPNASMPHVLWRLQGIQTPVFTKSSEEEPGVIEIDHLVLTTPGILTPDEYDNTVRDLVTYLEYMGEPAKLKRKKIGVWVILFLVVFAFLAYLLKAEYWRDIH